MIRLRSIGFNIAFVAATIVIGLVGLPVLLLPRRASMRFGTLWARFVLLLLRALTGISGEVRGRAQVPEGACLIAMKHQSMWDTLMLPIVLGDPAVIIKRELLFVPFYGWYSARAGSIFIDRKGGAAALRRMVAAAREAAAAGRPVVIFPQGTRAAPGAHLPYQPGVAALYQALKLPLVPAAVNSGLYWGRRSFLKRPGRIAMEFLPPIAPGLGRSQLMADLERRIEAATVALETEAADADAERSGLSHRSLFVPHQSGFVKPHD